MDGGGAATSGSGPRALHRFLRWARVTFRHCFSLLVELGLLLLLVGNKDLLVGRQGRVITRPKKEQADPHWEGDGHQRQQDRVPLMFGERGRRRRPDDGTGGGTNGADAK